MQRNGYVAHVVECSKCAKTFGPSPRGPIVDLLIHWEAVHPAGTLPTYLHGPSLAALILNGGLGW